MKNRYRIDTGNQTVHESTLQMAILEFGKWINFYSSNKEKYGEHREICLWDTYGKKEKLLGYQEV